MAPGGHLSHLKKQEDVQRRNVYPHDLLTIMVGAGLLIGTIPAKAWISQGTACVPALLREMD